MSLLEEWRNASPENDYEVRIAQLKLVIAEAFAEATQAHGSPEENLIEVIRILRPVAIEYSLEDR